MGGLGEEATISEAETKLAILNKLKENPRGMTIKQISDSLSFSRETVVKYVQALEYENEIYTVKFGNVEVYCTNHKKVREKDSMPLYFGNRTIFIDRLENDFGDFIKISETRKNGDVWERKGSILIPPEKLKELIRALKEIEERPEKVQNEN